MTKRFLIVGAGFAGAVLAYKLAESLDCSIDVWDERDHVGGNCHTKRDSSTGIMEHIYGPHIFNTDNKVVWDFVNQFDQFMPYTNRVKINSQNTIFSFPINLHTINQYFDKTFNPKEAEDFIKSIARTDISEPANFEEQALKFVGEDIYRAFFYGYTKKQWGCEPSELPASILKRLPLRFNYNDGYYNSKYQGIPLNGYTFIINKLLINTRISVELSKKFIPNEKLSYDHVFYTGPIDAYFGFGDGRLSYRTVYFEKNITKGDFQGNAVINYADENVNYTRVHEHKHFTPWETHEKSIYFREFSKETGIDDIPYYPKRLAADMQLLQKYKDRALKLSNTSFLGRLATYRYMDMHHVINESLDYAQLFIESIKNNSKINPFPID